MPPNEPRQFSGTAALAANQEQEPESWLKNIAQLSHTVAATSPSDRAVSAVNAAIPTSPATNGMRPLAPIIIWVLFLAAAIWLLCCN